METEKRQNLKQAAVILGCIAVGITTILHFFGHPKDRGPKGPQERWEEEVAEKNREEDQWNKDHPGKQGMRGMYDAGLSLEH